jgi:hypothetical protein
MSVVFAASHPERVSALVMYGSMARTMWAPDYLFGYTEREWRRGSGESIEDFVTPGALEAAVRSGFPSAEEEEVRAWARVFRYGGSPGTFEALDRMNAEIDVRHVLGVIRTPTLVLHQHADPWVRVEHGRYLAQHIPGAAYAELDGKEHIPPAAFAPQLLAHMIPFLQDAAGRESAEPDKVLATVLFSDIVGSTAVAAELGDVRWRELLAEHHVCVRRQLARFRGVEIDTAGDGFFARFDGPARGIRCALAVREAVRELGLEVRIGLHAGECQAPDLTPEPPQNRGSRAGSTYPHPPCRLRTGLARGLGVCGPTAYHPAMGIWVLCCQGGRGVPWSSRRRRHSVVRALVAADHG